MTPSEPHDRPSISTSKKHLQGRTDLIASYFTLSGAGLGEPARFSFASRVAAAAEAGFSGVGMTVEDYDFNLASGLSPEDMASIVGDTGLRVEEIEFLYGWASSDETLRERASIVERQLFTMADAFGSRHMNVSDFSTQTELAPIEEVTDRYRRLCERAAEHDLIVALEFLPWTAIGTLEIANEIVSEASRSNGGLLIDAWHFFKSNATLDQLSAISPNAVVAVQLDDARSGDAPTAESALNRLPPGHGDLQIEELVESLDRIGYSGPFSVEIFAPDHHNLPLDTAAGEAYSSADHVIRAARSAHMRILTDQNE